MTTCVSCSEKAIFNGFCKGHFCRDIEERVQDTIKRFGLIPKDAKILVAISGGKDSQVLLSILTSLGYSTDALLIDEGITGYREYTVEDTKALCRRLRVTLKIVPFREEFGYTLDTMLKKKRHKPCTLCGTFRRHTLNKYAQGYDVCATGHNLDDEAQVILMNIVSGQIDLLPRLGPRSGVVEHDKFVPRIKPLYLVSEKEVRLYAYVKGLRVSPKECPYVPQSFRGKLRDWLNTYENDHRGTKKSIIEWFLGNSEDLRGTVRKNSIHMCPKCGSHSNTGVCKACQLQAEVQY
jgi:uncharacterized protein (TIGR00269 family)